MGSDDIFRRVLAPAIEPVEPFLTHTLWKNCNAAARHDSTDRDSTAGIVAGRRPNRTVTSWIKLSGHDPRCQTRICGEHLVRGNHRESIAKYDNDRAIDTGEFLRQHDVVRH